MIYSPSFPLSPAVVGGGLVFLACSPTPKSGSGSCSAGLCQADSRRSMGTPTDLPGDANAELQLPPHWGLFPVSEI